MKKPSSVIRENLLSLVQKDIPDSELKKELRKLVEEKVDREIPILCMPYKEMVTVH